MRLWNHPIQQASGTNQGLIAARSMLTRQALTIPRLELVAGHMAVNLVANVSSTLSGLSAPIHCFLCYKYTLLFLHGLHVARIKRVCIDLEIVSDYHANFNYKLYNI